MIIDLILDRKYNDENGAPGAYDPKAFYLDCMEYGPDMGGHDIAAAMDCGTEDQVRQALVRYVHEFEWAHIPGIVEYIMSARWLPEEPAPAPAKAVGSDPRAAIAGTRAYRHILEEVENHEEFFGGSSIDFICHMASAWAHDVAVEIRYPFNWADRLVHHIKAMLLGPWVAAGVPLVERGC